VRRVNHLRSPLAAAILIALAALPVQSRADGLRGARIEGLSGDLRGVRARVDEAPRASVYDLKRLQRRLAEQRADTPDEPRLERLDLQLRHERWRAERVLRAVETAADRGRIEATRDRLAVPDELRPATDLDIRGSALPIGTGKRFLFVQSGLRAARAALDRGRTGAAAAQLAQAEAGLRALEEAWAGDPNLIALEAELRALEGRLAVEG
jgi:hypothetical protein